ncbi:MAG: hypothetical protein SGPRY_003839, partial [Prymnesium sp.]
MALLATALCLAPPPAPRLTRRAMCAAACLSLACRVAPPVPASATPAFVTQRVQLDVSIGTDDARPIVIGLYGEDAPASSRMFAQLCSATVPDAPGMGYTGSVASRVERDKAIVIGRPSGGQAQYLERSIDSTGYVRTNVVNRADSFISEDKNTLSHDRPGVVSMRRGGGDFEFVITPTANPSLDAERVVVGEVLDGLDVVAEMNAVPARRPSKENEASRCQW